MTQARSQSAGIPSTGSHRGARPSKARAPCQKQVMAAIKAAAMMPSGENMTAKPPKR